MRSKVFEILSSSSSSSSPINFEREIVVVEREKQVPEEDRFCSSPCRSFFYCVKLSSRKGERIVSREISFVSFFNEDHHRRESSDEKRLSHKRTIKVVSSSL